MSIADRDVKDDPAFKNCFAFAIAAIITVSILRILVILVLLVLS